MPNYTLDKPRVNKGRDKISRSPIRELFESGRLTDLLEFLANHYGIEGEEALAVLGGLNHARS
jgi:hypothetical protein